MNKELKNAIENLFEQLKFIAKNLNDNQFSQPLISLSGSSIGQHFRHTLEFFKCLLTDESGLVNYDKRNHDKSLESSTEEILNLIALQNSAIQALDSNKNIMLELSYGYEQGTTNVIQVESNLYRELVYNIEHVIHHMALIKIGIIEIMPDFEIPAGFGIASSTIRYKETQKV